MGAPRRLWRSLARSAVLDALLAAGLTLVVLADLAGNAVPASWLGARAPDAAGVALALAQTVPVAWHRRHPGPVLALTLPAYLLAVMLNYPMRLGMLATLVPLYGVALRAPRLGALAALGLAEAAAALTALAPRQGTAGQLPDLAVVYAAVWLLGLAHRRLRQEQAASAERAVLAERARIARELHDIVAHHVSAMAIQASAARTVLTSDPDEADAALRFIRDSCADALTELRRLIGLLNGAGDTGTGGTAAGGAAGAGAAAGGAAGGADAGDALAPQPGLDRLRELVDRTSRAGLPVELVVEGDPRPLPAALEVTAYRIVQEALTNSLRHAGPARARVVVRHAADHLELTVLDDGRGADGATAGRAGGGYGLVGMRERVALFGGTLTAGPRQGAGFQVHARLPLPAPATTATTPPSAGTTVSTAAPSPPAGTAGEAPGTAESAPVASATAESKTVTSTTAESAPPPAAPGGGAPAGAAATGRAR